MRKAGKNISRQKQLCAEPMAGENMVGFRRERRGETGATGSGSMEG